MLTSIKYLAALFDLNLYRRIEKYKKTKPIKPTNTPDRGVKYNFPVTPKTGIKDAKTVHKVYKIACSAVLLSLLPVGSIKNPAFS